MTTYTQSVATQTFLAEVYTKDPTDIFIVWCFDCVDVVESIAKLQRMSDFDSLISIHQQDYFQHKFCVPSNIRELR